MPYSYPEYGNIVSDFSDEVMSLGAGVAVFGIGVWHLLSKRLDTMKYMKQIAEGAAFAVGSTIALRSAWTHTKSKRFTRKYLADLKHLQ